LKEEQVNAIPLQAWTGPEGSRKLRRRMLIKLDVIYLTVTKFFASLDFIYKINAIHILRFDRKVDLKFALNFSMKKNFLY
jgi:hypothetical protein